MGFTGLVLLYVSSGHYREYMFSAGAEPDFARPPHSPNSDATVPRESPPDVCMCSCVWVRGPAETPG